MVELLLLYKLCTTLNAFYYRVAVCCGLSRAIQDVDDDVDEQSRMSCSSRVISSVNEQKLHRSWQFNEREGDASVEL